MDRPIAHEDLVKIFAEQQKSANELTPYSGFQILQIPFFSELLYFYGALEQLMLEQPLSKNKNCRMTKSAKRIFLPPAKGSGGGVALKA